MSTPQQAKLVDGRITQISTNAGAPTDGFAGAASMFTLAPVTLTGLPTTGFLFMLKAVVTAPATPGAGGFTLNWWLKFPSGGFWGALDPITGVNYDEAWVTFDVDACELYLDVENTAVAGQIIVCIAEQ